MQTVLPSSPSGVHAIPGRFLWEYPLLFVRHDGFLKAPGILLLAKFGNHIRRILRDRPLQAKTEFIIVGRIPTG